MSIKLLRPQCLLNFTSSGKQTIFWLCTVLSVSAIRGYNYATFYSLTENVKTLEIFINSMITPIQNLNYICMICEELLNFLAISAFR